MLVSKPDINEGNQLFELLCFQLNMAENKLKIIKGNLKTETNKNNLKGQVLGIQGCCQIFRQSWIWEFWSIKRIPTFSPSLSPAYLCKTLCYRKSLLVLDDHWESQRHLSLAQKFHRENTFFPSSFFERSPKEESEGLRCLHMNPSPAVTHPGASGEAGCHYLAVLQEKPAVFAR